MRNPLTEIKVNNEYGTLREIIFGRVDDFRLPEYDPVAFQWLDKGMLELLKRGGGKLFSEAAPDWYGPVHDQVEAAVDLIESRGVIVHRPAENTKTELANFALQSQKIYVKAPTTTMTIITAAIDTTAVVIIFVILSRLLAMIILSNYVLIDNSFYSFLQSSS